MTIKNPLSKLARILAIPFLVGCSQGENFPIGEAYVDEGYIAEATIKDNGEVNMIVKLDKNLTENYVKVTCEDIKGECKVETSNLPKGHSLKTKSSKYFQGIITFEREKALENIYRKHEPIEVIYLGNK